MKIDTKKLTKTIKHESKSITKDIIRSIVKDKIKTNFIDKPILPFGKTIYVTHGGNVNTLGYTTIKRWIFENCNKNMLKYIPVNKNVLSVLKNGTYRFRYKNCLITVIQKSFGEKTDLYLNILGKNQEMIYNEILSKLQKKKDVDKFIINKWDGGFGADTILKRPKETIFSDQYDYISNIIKNQKHKKEIYKKHYLPFKTGILLHGKPGTGKTSIIKSLATEFTDYRLIIINLTELGNKELEKCISELNEMKSDKIILLEEIDLGIKQKQSLDENRYVEGLEPSPIKKISLLLNWLDGVNTPDNTIFIATTNYLDRVDERIKRTGRFDYQIEVTDICKETAIKMCKHFEADPNKILTKDLEILTEDGIKYSPSKIQEVILKSL